MTRATFNKGATIIALRPIPAMCGRAFEPGDVVNWRRLALGERRVGQMIDQNRLGELTQENFDFALQQRADQDVPRGHTAAGLEALGITFTPPPKPTAPKATPDLAYVEEKAHRGFILKGVKRGVVMRYDVFNAEGERVNGGGTLAKKAVDVLIDNIEAERARLETAKAPATEEAKDLGGDGYGDQGSNE